MFPAVIVGAMISMAFGEEPEVVDLTGPYTAIVNVRNSDGSTAGGVRYKLSYATPSKREVLLDEGTPRERKFQFEPIRLSATVAAGTIPADGIIRFHQLAGAPRTFSLHIGDDGSRPGDFFEGSSFLQISFTNRITKTNVFIVEAAKTVGLGERAPDFAVEDVFTHERLQLSDFKGKLVVLKFWAADCPPCQPEMKECNEFIARKKKDWKDAVTFVAVGMEDNVELLRKHVLKQGWNEFRHVWAKDTNAAFRSGIAQNYGVRAVPACYILHPGGRVVWRGNRGNIEWLINHFLTELRDEGDVLTWVNEVREDTGPN